MAFHPVYWMTDCGSTEEAMHRNEGTDGPIHTGSPCHRHVGVPDCGMVCRPAVSPSPQEEQESCQQKAPVAQSDRAIDFESKGRGFDSLQARHLYPASMVPLSYLTYCPNLSGFFRVSRPTPSSIDTTVRDFSSEGGPARPTQ